MLAEASQAKGSQCPFVRMIHCLDAEQRGGEGFGALVADMVDEIGLGLGRPDDLPVVHALESLGENMSAIGMARSRQ